MSLALLALAAAAAPEPGLTIVGTEAFFYNALVALGGVALGVGVVIWVLWRRAHETALVRAAVSKLAAAKAERHRLETLIAAEPQLVLLFEGAAAEGPARLMGSAPELLDLLGLKRSAAGEALLASLEGAIGASEGAALDQAIARLRHDGTPFRKRLTLGERGGLLVEGRPFGGECAVWIKEIHAERQEIVRLERKLAEAEAERDLFAEMLDKAAVPIWRRDRELKLAWVNTAYASAVEAASPERAIEAQAELDRSEGEMARLVLETGAPAKARKYVVVGGERRSFEISEEPVAGGLVGYALDQTAEDQALQDLRRHIAAHADTLNKLATAVAIFGPDQRLRFYNQAYQQLWRLDEGWLESAPTDGEILDRLRELRRLPEQSDYQAWKRERLQQYTEVQERPDDVWHLPDGRTLRMVAQPHPFGGLIYLFEDVSGLVALESSLNRLIGVQKGTLDNLFEGVALFGSDGRLKLYNPAFVDIWHLKNRNLDSEPHFDQVTQWCSLLFGEADDWRPLRSVITEISRERRTVEGKQGRADGSVIQFAGIPLPDGATLLSFFDISDRIRIERALTERNDALEAADRLKSEFVGHVSYHLRTPLNTIQGFGQMLDGGLAGELNERQREYASAILQASDQLMSLINDILDLATIEAGAMALEIGEIELYQVLSAAVNLTSKKALDAGLTLKLDCDPSVGDIRADERRIKQIVFNLLSNAIAFTPEGGEVVVGADRSGAHVRIWVTDTGSGIAPQRMANVFERFESHSGEGRRGVGLGLSLVKSFVELHGGWVALESAEGVGTQVVCHLPERAVQNRDAAE